MRGMFLLGSAVPLIRFLALQCLCARLSVTYCPSSASWTLGEIPGAARLRSAVITALHWHRQMSGCLMDSQNVLKLHLA